MAVAIGLQWIGQGSSPGLHKRPGYGQVWQTLTWEGSLQLMRSSDSQSPNFHLTSIVGELIRKIAMRSCDLVCSENLNETVGICRGMSDQIAVF